MEYNASNRRYFKIERKDICYFQFIIDSYEGIANISTMDSKKGIIVIDVSPDLENDFNLVIEEIKKEIYIEEIIQGVQYERKWFK